MIVMRRSKSRNIPLYFRVDDGAVRGMLKVADRDVWRTALARWRRFEAAGFNMPSSEFHIWRGGLISGADFHFGEASPLNRFPHEEVIHQWLFDTKHYHSPCLGEVLLELAAGSQDIILSDGFFALEHIIMEGADGKA